MQSEGNWEENTQNQSMETQLESSEKLFVHHKLKNIVAQTDD
jgi:hypothetical protein